MPNSQRRPWMGRLAAGAAAAVCGGMLLPLPAMAAPDGGVIINEAYLKGGSSNAVYTQKFIELYNDSDTAQSLDGWSIQYRSASGSSGPSVNAALSGTIAPNDYYLLAWEGNGANGAALPVEPDIDFGGSLNASGTSGTIYLADTTAALTLPTGSVVDDTDDVVDLIGYGSSATFEGAVVPVTGSNSTPNSLARTDFVDTDENSADFSHPAEITPQASSGTTEPEPEPTPTETASPTPTPTETSSPTPTPTAPAEITAIADIQGTEDASPLAGQTVTTRGVVTAAYPTGSFNGFYIQTSGTGGALDLATHTASDGIFVYAPAAKTKVAIGDDVEVTGAVSERYGLTEISAEANDVTILGEEPDAVVPAEVSWPLTETQRESLEGMLLLPQGEFTVSNTYQVNFDGYIGLASGTEPLIEPTEVGGVGSAEYEAAIADNDVRGILVDDGTTYDYQPYRAESGTPLPYLTAEDPVRVGSSATFTSPVVLDYRYDEWGLQPLEQLTGANADDVQPVVFDTERPGLSPEDVGGDIQLASFNVLNYFTTTGEDAEQLGATCTYYEDRSGEPVGVRRCSDPAVRGAADDEDLARQQVKIVAAINGLGAEIVSLEEIENSTIAGEDRDAAVATLVDALNADLGADEWAFAPSPAAVPADEDVIRTAFIYKTDAVVPVGESEILDDPSVFFNAREPLAQAFAPVGGDEDDAFLAIVNHLKSKGDSDDSASGDNVDGPQGAYNGDRTRQATALVAFAEELEAEYGTDEVFLMGDFNAYTEEDPMQVLYDAGYTDLGSTLTDKYSYSYDGMSGSLDHILASEGALEMVTGADIWNINAPEAVALEYSRYNYNVVNFYDESLYRASDHDPVVVGLALPEPDDGITELQLLNINDFHGRIDDNTVKFAGTIEQLRAEYGEENTLFLSAGDNVGASLFASAVADDQPTIDVMNALELAASAVGNHEFDRGYDDITDRLALASDYPILGANVYEAGTEDPALPEYATFEVDGLTVAVIGAITQETPSLVSPGGIEGLDFGDPVEAVNRVAAEIEDDVDVIVAEYHEGAMDGIPEGVTLEEEIAAGGAFAEIVTDTSAAVDAIFTGHTHKEYVWDGPIPGEEGTRPIVQTGSYGENIGQVVLDLDSETGEVIDYSAANVARLASEEFEDDDEATDAASDALDQELIETYPRVAEVADIVDEALAYADEIGSQPKGSVTADITTAFTGGSYVDGVYTGGSRDNRAGQSSLGNLVADALVDSLSSELRGGAEIGVVNPGGLRNELYYEPDGVITYAEANSVLPFVNNLWTTSLTGAQFVEALEQQWQPDGASRPYLQLGLSENVQYTYDDSAPDGEHITGVWIDGEPIDMDAEYRIGSFNFLLQGGDNFTAFTEGADTRDSGLIDRDVWIAYLEANPGLSPEFDSTKAQVTGVPDTIGQGETLSIALSGINMSSLGAPENTTIEASIGDTVYPAFEMIDGVAQIALEIPEDAAAESTLVLTAPQSGTEVIVPLTVTGQLDPGEPGTGEPGTGEPGTPGSPMPPTTTPTPVPEGQITVDTQNGALVISGNLIPGSTITLNLGLEYAGHWVSIWLYSTPQQLGGWQQVAADGTVTVTLPSDVTGTHRIVVLDANGEIIAWQQIVIEDPSLAATGGDAGQVPAMLFAVILLIGAGIGTRVMARRRRA